MADLQTKSMQTLVAEQVAIVQGSSTGLVDFTVGSILLAIVEAYSAVALWLQALVLKVLAITRAATSTGPDLDSWMADYGLIRLGATYATGQATFSRFTATSQAVIPIGALIQTADGSQQYVTTLDVTNTAYNAGLNGYVIGAGVSSVIVPIIAVSPGTAGNAAIGGIALLGQAIPFVDSVTNAAALANGSNAETDAALRVRFVRYLASLSKATKAAIGYAVASVETGITYTLVENENYDGSPNPGFFYVVADDGSGEPSTALLNQIYAAIDAVRGFTIRFAVFGPQVETANVVLQISVAAGYDPTVSAGLVQTAIANYINALPLGSSLPWSRLIQVAYDASPAVVSVSGLTLNGGTADLAANDNQVVKAGTIAAATI